MRRKSAGKTPYFTTVAEQYPIARAGQLKALKELLNDSMASDKPVDPQLLENMKIWATGDKDAWMEAEFKRIFGSK